MSELNNIIAALIIVIVIVIAMTIWYIIKYPNYNNNVLNTIKFYRNWQWVNPIPSNGNPNVPYIFDILPNNQLQLSYYDDKGYLKGFSTYILNYSAVDINTIQLSLSSITINYSQVTPTFPWTVKYIDSKHITTQINGTSQLLEVL